MIRALSTQMLHKHDNMVEHAHVPNNNYDNDNSNNNNNSSSDGSGLPLRGHHVTQRNAITGLPDAHTLLSLHECTSRHH